MVILESNKTSIMKNWTFTAFVFFLSMCFIAAGYGQDLTADFDRIVADNFDNPDGPGYVIQITKGGETIYHKGFGKANIELDIDMRPDHVFRIGSITKQFTACAVLRLQEEGKLSVSDDITKYITDYPTHGHVITIDHLLTHTSGIRSYTSMPEFRDSIMRVDMTVESLVDFFKDEPMDFAPDEKELYNNSAYILLGHIIELVSGSTYEDYIEKEFFEPLGMLNSRYDNTDEIVKNRVAGYENHNGKIVNAPYLSMTLPYAAGSLMSTTDDLAKWYHAVMKDKVISAESRVAAHTSATLADGSETGYGYGWGVSPFRGNKQIGHGGGINGFSTDSKYFPESDIFVTIFSNGNSVGRIMKHLCATAIGQPIEEVKTVEIEEQWKDKYPGIYQLENGMVLNIDWENDKLMAKPSGQNAVEITPTGKHEFFVKLIDSKLVFIEENGEINELELHQGKGYVGKRITIESADISTEELNKYIGTYEIKPGMNLVFTNENGVLIGDQNGQKVTFTYTGGLGFFAEKEGVRIRFQLNDAGVADGVHLKMGQDIFAKKIK